MCLSLHSWVLLWMIHIFERLANVGGERNGRWTAGRCAGIPVWGFIIQYSYQSAFLAPLFARWESFCHCLMCLCVVLNRLSCIRPLLHFHNGIALHTRHLCICTQFRCDLHEHAVGESD